MEDKVSEKLDKVLNALYTLSISGKNNVQILYLVLNYLESWKAEELKKEGGNDG